MASLIDDQVKKQMKTLAKEQEAIRNRKKAFFLKRLETGQVAIEDKIVNNN